MALQQSLVRWRLLAAVMCCAGLGWAGTDALAKPSRAAQKQNAAPIDIDAFNNATDTPLLRPGSRGPAVARAQILLDRAWYSSGEIDGRFAANMQRIVKAYQLAHGLKATGTVTPQTWQALREEGAPALVRYTVTDKDAVGPFEKIPANNNDRGQLKAMPYESLEEALAERFHTSTAYLKQLNAGAKLAAGSEIVVPNVNGGKPPANAASIEIDKAARVLYLLDARKRPLAAFPISIGNEKSDPLPIGVMSIKNEVKNPSFTYDPVLLKNQPKDAQKMELAPGPNNPIGNIWLGLSKKHWGIHGTANPSNVGHSETNGCIHLTNWDAERVSTLAKAGFKVDVRP
ncbi:L,D-transpeptidase family protein [Ramlibacter sp. WS9]|uniref:L,D-transpeptidase family protein n=1 Tax=Ramlibacter sp. WS9 TaxID=1882741 RepID=UPI0011433F40|nr:L,D-transpeptidase family protein [Ramlibacter sp. WS9]ROZ62950.1 murein L,D-transpeptidase [Ramlibacter sp. WS9]